MQSDKTQIKRHITGNWQKSGDSSQAFGTAFKTNGLCKTNVWAVANLETCPSILCTKHSLAPAQDLFLGRYATLKT
jgi:hypothetical protein